MADDQNVAQGIVKARAAGYSDDEIASHLADKLPGVKQAKEAGYSTSEILSHLAGSTAAPAAPEQTGSTVSDVAMQIPTGFNEGLANTVGAPVDAMSWALRKAGLNIPNNAFAGSQSIKNGLGYIGANPDNAPAQTTAGKFARSAGDMAAQAILPEAAVAGVASRLGPKVANVAQQVVGDGSNMARTAATGAAAGVGAEAAGQATEGTSLEPMARIGGAVLGGGAAARLAAMRSAVKPQALPDAAAVKADAQAAYNDPILSQSAVDPAAVNRMAAKAQADLMSNGFRPKYEAGQTFDHLDELMANNMPTSIADLHAARKALGRIAKGTQDGKATEAAAAAMQAKGHVDDFLNNLQARDVVSGDPQAAVQALRNADANYGAYARSSNVTRLLDNAQIDAGSVNSGRNVENRIRQTFKPLLKNGGQKMSGYSPEERDAVSKLVRGSYVSDALRTVGNMVSRTGHIGLGVSLYSPATLIPAMAAEGGGYALKGLANRMAVNRTKALASKLLERAPLAQPVVAANKAVKQANTAAARHLMLINALRGMGGNTTGN